MLIIAGVVKTDPTRRDEVVAAAIAVMNEVRKQPGCISYVISADLEDPSVLHLFQEWQSEQMYRAYAAGPLVGSARFAAGDPGMQEASIQRYEIASVGPLV